MTDTSVASTAGPAARSPRWMRWLLVVSLAINLLIVGFVGGWAVWRHRHGDLLRSGLDGGFVRFVSHLPAERRDRVRDIINAGREELKSLRGEVRTARAEVSRLLSADPLDQAGLASANTRLGEALGRLRTAAQSRLPEIAALLTADERRRFVEWRERARERGWHRRWRGNDDADGL